MVAQPNKEALFFKVLDEKKVQCVLCPHNCLVKDGSRGICKVRKNQGGKLFSLVYGKIIAAHIDPIEKKPLFHFLPGSRSFSIATMGCNLRCAFCQNYTISQVNHSPIIGEEMRPEEVVAAAEIKECRSISYTYTEPTIFFEFAYDCAKLAHEKGIKNIFVTNGFINPEPLKTVAPYLDAANVDLKSFSEEYYRKICGAQLKPVLETLKLLKELKIWIEVTTLVVPGKNDSPEELRSIANFIKQELGEDVPWHVSAFFPHYKMLDVPPTTPEGLNQAREIGFEAGLKYVYSGNIPTPGTEDTFCPRCEELIINRSGFHIAKNRIKDGKCPSCGVEIAGVW